MCLIYIIKSLATLCTKMKICSYWRIRAVWCMGSQWDHKGSLMAAYSTGRWKKGEQNRGVYVHPFQPFNLYPFTHNRIETVSQKEDQRWLSSEQKETESPSHSPTTISCPNKQKKQLNFFCLLSQTEQLQAPVSPPFPWIRNSFPEIHILYVSVHASPAHRVALHGDWELCDMKVKKQGKEKKWSRFSEINTSVIP